MAVAPKFAGHILQGSPHIPHHTLEVYLDYVCPVCPPYSPFLSSSPP